MMQYNTKTLVSDKGIFYPVIKIMSQIKTMI